MKNQPSTATEASAPDEPAPSFDREEMQRRLDAASRFPDLNPNPVLRMDDVGRLIYFNAASRPLVDELHLEPGRALPDALLAPLRAALVASEGEAIEVRAGPRTYSLKPVAYPAWAFVNIYGTDVSAARAVERFPDRNPNPVLRVDEAGRLMYANPASAPIIGALGLVMGQALPTDLWEALRARAGSGSDETLVVQGGTRWYELVSVPIPEFGFSNVYGTDITAARQVEEALRQVREAHEENERLLLNILPAPIAARLKAGEKVIADRHEDLSLLFADIVGFTQMSSRLTPTEVVDLLDDLFRNLDDLVDEYRLEKIKTIGDAYMVVGGLPPEADDHLARIASMALDLNHILATRTSDHPVRMRMGLHAGPAVAGVIGARKFIYDVWGATVNTASRLEAFGLPDEIQVTEAVQARLDDRFMFEPRGIVDLKGLGPTRTWFLRGRKGRAIAPTPAARLA